MLVRDLPILGDFPRTTMECIERGVHQNTIHVDHVESYNNWKSFACTGLRSTVVVYFYATPNEDEMTKEVLYIYKNETR